MQKKKVLYLIPKKVIGGAEIIHENFVESETKTSIILKRNLKFQKIRPYYIYRSFKWLKSFIMTQKIDIVVSSLWRSHLICLLVSKFIKIEIIPFFHSSSFRSSIDRIISKKILHSSHCFIADSEETKSFIHSVNSEKKGFTVSLFLSEFFFRKKKFPDKLQKFIFVGRLHKVKNIPETIRILSLYSIQNPELDICFDLYGPQVKNNQFMVDKVPKNLKINFQGTLKPEMVLPTILKYDCFIQTSINEGFSMVAKEALRSGQLCILTAVGDLKNCLNEENCIIHNSVELTVKQMNSLSQSEYSKKSMNAFKTFRNIESFNKSFTGVLDKINGKT